MIGDGYLKANFIRIISVVCGRKTIGGRSTAKQPLTTRKTVYGPPPPPTASSVPDVAKRIGSHDRRRIKPINNPYCSRPRIVFVTISRHNRAEGCARPRPRRARASRAGGGRRRGESASTPRAGVRTARRRRRIAAFRVPRLKITN
ncbi:hypothetical protein EVAR_2452_1 [Eumeta japonica]|uniref:Uncharacterized protein n=1 Tax=Eumeta variegata TaxID=151549 RepID=A0A4C1SRA1_EUMVA|nr:hypothetical protein EVAR_2452_1 [Eumeta japonica]